MNDGRQPNLFRVVSDVWAKPIYCTSEVAIRALDNLGGCHARLERLKNAGESGMIHLPAKFLKSGGPPLPPTSCGLGLVYAKYRFGGTHSSEWEEKLLEETHYHGRDGLC